MSVSRASMYLGQCLPCLKKNVSKFNITKMILDPNLRMYFPESTVLYAHDPQKLCKTGDVVLIEELKEKFSREVTHKVLEVVYPCGDITDPITGKKLSGGKYRDEEEEISEMYGKHPNSFDYKSAPPRGWQEDKKDFTHVDTYTKYNASDDSPYAV
ncbi:mitochondrial ribosomal protein S17 [Lycorma delicatula]|uniref:mitochondrial ribosomal protein S17 n=1 Tax=Lycorma delicatula TaxID=130591 RepID=UPI003F516FF4